MLRSMDVSQIFVILLGLEFTVATFNFENSGNSIIIIDDSEGVCSTLVSPKYS